MPASTQQTVRIYTGPVLLVEALTARLEEKGIIPIVRDDQQNAVMFGSGSNFTDQLRIFVREDELTDAQEIVRLFEIETANNS